MEVKMVKKGLKKQQRDDKAVQKASLPELKRLAQEMQPSGKVNDIHAIRLVLIGIIAKIEELQERCEK